MCQQDFGSRAQAQSQAAVDCTQKTAAPRPLQAPKIRYMHRCWPCWPLDSWCCPATRRRSECTACWYETSKKEGAAATHLEKPQVGCRSRAVAATHPGDTPKASCTGPGRRLLLLDCLAGLRPSSYVSWTYFLTCLQQNLGCGAGNFFLTRILYRKSNSPSQVHTTHASRRSARPDVGDSAT
jgi:hypothetical protein